MIPFLVMLGVILAARALGALGVELVDSWQAATRIASRLPMQLIWIGLLLWVAV